jgi:hypothetical protein
MQFGGEVAVEIGPIERWLELEVGAQAVWGGGAGQFSVDLLVKKPFSLATRISVMPALGPLVVEVSAAGRRTTYFGIEAALDVMWWVFSDHVGLGFEPSVALTFGPLRPSIGITFGPIVGW